ncbi:hypothetical protein BH11MYX1_BH11MYX1_19430 [soil metagenome]
MIRRPAEIAAPARSLLSAVRTSILTVIVGLWLAGTSSAQAPNTARAFREGANHHLGDAAFVAEFGRPPTEHDEELRIRTHFLAVKELLASRSATRPELAANRAKLLAHFDDYIAKGTTPKNAHLPWRTPVFIDDEGTICAVGYLIEQSAGRLVAEKIASRHRYAYLEEIVAAMPEVQRWVEQSGFTLEELASIQPGYEGPDIARETGWTLASATIPDGEYARARVAGTIRHHHMQGMWSVTDGDGHVVGGGTFEHGAAAWYSLYADGTPMAAGRYVNDQPSGRWRFFHASGNLAAEGVLSHGSRDGRWRFFYDTPKHTELAVGRFDHGWTIGTWRHFDADGKLLAVSTATAADGRFLLDVMPDRDRVDHQIDQQGNTGDHHRLDMMTRKHEHIFVQEGVDAIYDQRGNELVHAGETWSARACGWSSERRRLARRGDISALHTLIMQDRFADRPGCEGAATGLSAERGSAIDTMLASVRAVRAQSPEFMTKVALGEATVHDATDPDADPEADLLGRGEVEDLAKVLAANMTWYIEWPHIDGRFVAVYATLAGITGTAEQ